MPHRRPRKTNRVPQEERRLRVRGQRRDVPDVKRLSKAFIGLALARAGAEAEAQAQAVPRPDGDGDRIPANEEHTRESA